MREEQELQSIQLAAISTASMQNSESAVKDRISRDSPYCTQAYLDVCTAVDREMKHRNENTRLRELLYRVSSVFKSYAVTHKHKGTWEGDRKAKANENIATIIDNELAVGGGK